MGNRDADAVAAALLYTNREGEVVYANRQFVLMMGYEMGHPIIGASLASVLAVAPDVVTPLLDDKAHVQTELILDLPASDEDPIAIRCIADPAYDEQRRFIGRNITFKKISKDAAPVEPPDQPVLSPSDAEGALLRVYAASQVIALQVMLARLLGLGIKTKMNAALNDQAHRHGWTLAIVQDDLEFDTLQTTPEMLAGLITEARAFAVGIAGEQMVSAEMSRVDGSVSAAVRQRAEQFGLRSDIETL